MTKRIFRSICLTAFSVFFVSLILIIGALYGYFSDVQQAQLKMQTSLAAQGVMNEGMEYFRNFEVENYRMTWIDIDGTVLYDSESDMKEMENHLEREEVREALATGYGESRRYSATLMERSFYSAQRLSDGSILRLSIAQNSVFPLLLGMAQPIGVIFSAAVLLSVVMAVRISKRIVEPLNEIDLDHPLSNEGYNELSPLLRRMDSQQKQLRQTEQIRREFTANVSHELKTPLHSISGYAELLKNNMVKQEDIVPFAGRIYEEAQRMARLVEDIISLSHLDEGAKDMKRETIDLYELAGKAVQSLKPEAEAAGVSLELSGGQAFFEGIGQLLYSIVYNLCDNAIKYNRENGTVAVTVQNEADKIVLSVRDTGIGIAPEHQERIFERFYRVDKSHSKEAGGTGLGLSIVKHAAKIHNAKINVDSTAGKGTIITVNFPKSYA